MAPLTLLANVKGGGLPGAPAPGVEQAGVDGCGEDVQVERRASEAGQGGAEDDCWSQWQPVIYDPTVLLFAMLI